jgi:signal peptidase I
MERESVGALRRGWAALLALIGPWGIGQLRLGQTRRALLWLCALLAGSLVGSRGVLRLGPSLGHGRALSAVAVLLVLGWLASILDVYIIPATRLRPAKLGVVATYYVLGMSVLLCAREWTRRHTLERFAHPTGSMEPTILSGEEIFVDKTLHRPPRRGDVVLFRYPEHPSDLFIMRAAGLPGDVVQVRNGHLHINGWAAPTCRVGDAVMPSSDDPPIPGSIHLEVLEGKSYLIFLSDADAVVGGDSAFTVSAGELWVLGDARNQSNDSRRWRAQNGGGVPFDEVTGLASFRFTSSEPGRGTFDRYGSSIDTPLLPPWARALQPQFEQCMAQLAGKPSTPPSAALR